MKQTNGGARWWSEDKSFYLVLMLCLMAVAAAAYLLFAFPNAQEESTLEATEYQAEDSVTASEALERVPAMDPSAETDAEPTQKTTDAADTEESVDAIAEEVVPVTLRAPLTGDIVREYSGDTLTYDETTGDWRTHEAIDYGGNAGDPVLAAGDGTVLAVGEDAIYGTYVTISHAQGITSLYAGLADVSVSEGDTVTAGTQIAVLGDPMPLEEKQGVHLHFSVTDDAGARNPGDFFD